MAGFKILWRNNCNVLKTSGVGFIFLKKADAALARVPRVFEYTIDSTNGAIHPLTLHLIFSVCDETFTLTKASNAESK